LGTWLAAESWGTKEKSCGEIEGGGKSSDLQWKTWKKKRKKRLSLSHQCIESASVKKKKDHGINNIVLGRRKQVVGGACRRFDLQA